MDIRYIGGFCWERERDRMREKKILSSRLLKHEMNIQWQCCCYLLIFVCEKRGIIKNWNYFSESMYFVINSRSRFSYTYVVYWYSFVDKIFQLIPFTLFYSFLVILHICILLFLLWFCLMNIIKSKLNDIQINELNE